MNQSTYISTLTPLRGIAALLVVVFHSVMAFAPLVAPDTTHLIANGWLWVDFFFILSGFILSHVYGSNFQGSFSRTYYWEYIRARFARVYPLHLATLLFTVGCGLLMVKLASKMMPHFYLMFDLEALPASLLLLQSMHLFPTTPFNGPSWSLSTEWWMYMIFPFLVQPFFRLKVAGKWMVLVGIVSMYLILMYYIAPRWANRLMIEMGFAQAMPTLNVTADWGILRCFAGFTLGMLLYQLYHLQTAFRWLNSGWVFIVSFALTLAAMHFNWHQMLIIASFPVVILSAAYNQDFVKRFLETRPLQRLGDWSFSIYLVHMLIAFAVYCVMLLRNPHKLSSIEAFGYGQLSYAQGWLQCLWLVVATLIISAFTYHYFEVPSRKYLNSSLKLRAKKTVSETVVS